MLLAFQDAPCGLVRLRLAYVLSSPRVGEPPVRAPQYQTHRQARHAQGRHSRAKRKVSGRSREPDRPACAWSYGTHVREPSTVIPEGFRAPHNRGSRSPPAGTGIRGTEPTPPSLPRYLRRTVGASPRVLSSRRYAPRLLLPARATDRLFVPRYIGGQILEGWLPMSDRCLRRGGPDWVSLRPSGACSEGDYRNADAGRPHDTLHRFHPSTRR
jgi:hypothetical protein